MRLFSVLNVVRLLYDTNNPIGSDRGKFLSD